MSKDKKPKDTAPVQSTGAADDPEEYTQHLLVPLAFKMRLDRIAIHVNQQRKTKDKKAKKLPTGWYVVTQLDDWLTRMEAELDQKKAP